jgi:hypothetical protein
MDMRNEMMYSQHTFTYLSLRKAVGLIGMLLPFMLMLGNSIIYKGAPVLRSISVYYYSPMRDVFVGALCTMAAFFFFYSGDGRRDRLAGILAGFLMLGVVLFPTTLEGTRDWIGWMHYAFAGPLFLHLAWIAIFHFPKKPLGVKIETTDKIQITCGLIMIACAIAVLVYELFFSVEGVETCFLFAAETVALIAFGLSWFTEGIDLENEIL